MTSIYCQTFSSLEKMYAEPQCADWPYCVCFKTARTFVLYCSLKQEFPIVRLRRSNFEPINRLRQTHDFDTRRTPLIIIHGHSIRNGDDFRTVFRSCIACKLFIISQGSTIVCLLIKGWSIFIMRQSKPLYVKSILVWKSFFQRNGDDSQNMIVLSYW